MIKLLIGVIVLILGIPIGNILALKTKGELKAGQKWFKIITIISLAGGIVGLIISNDVLLFTMFFIAVVVSRSIRKGEYKK
jgi:NADH:ubiquinone oxidoreductase subunit 4 (subunit M)